MKSPVVLNEKERAAVVNYYSEQIRLLQAQADKIRDELTKMISRLSEFVDDDHTVTAIEFGKYIDFDTSAPLWKKVEYILRTEGRILNTREIAVVIDGLESASSNELRVIISSLGATLKQKVDKSEVFSRILIKGEWYYGLVSWFDDEGFVRKDYTRYDVDDDTVHD